MQILNRHIDGTPEDCVYIGRGSALGNLKVIGKDGTRAEVIAWYRDWLLQKLLSRDYAVEKVFRSLDEDSKLLCFCTPKPCHGEVIVEYWEIVNQAETYEEGLKYLEKAAIKKAYAPTASDYRYWLINKLISRDPAVTQDFRALELSAVLIPEEFREIKDLSELVIIPLYNSLIDNDNYDINLNHLAKTNGLMVDYSPLTDGVTHINIYSKGQTDLGRALTNFAKIGFNHPQYGKFESLEGYWYWFATGKVHEVLRDLYGYQAKEAGKKFERFDVPNFEQEMKFAMYLKIEQNPELKEQLKNSTLPFAHYYFYGSTGNSKIVANDSSKWFVDYIELLRQYAQGKAQRVIIAGSRSIEDFELIKNAYIDSGFNAVLFVNGGARGVDTLGAKVANDRKLPIQYFIPDWEKHGRSAGMIRNRQMAQNADALLAAWDGISPGTKNMIDNAKALDLQIHILEVQPIVPDEI